MLTPFAPDFEQPWSCTGTRRLRDARRINAGVADRDVDAIASDNDAVLDDVALDDVLTLEVGVFEANVRPARPDDPTANRVPASASGPRSSTFHFGSYGCGTVLFRAECDGGSGMSCVFRSRRCPVAS